MDAQQKLENNQKRLQRLHRVDVVTKLSLRKAADGTIEFYNRKTEQWERLRNDNEKDQAF